MLPLLLLFLLPQLPSLSGHPSAAAVAIAESAELSLWPMPASAKTLGASCLTLSAHSFELKSASTSAILRKALSRYRNLTFLPGAPSQPCSNHASAPAAQLKGLTVTLESDDETLGPATSENYTLTVSAPTAVLTAASVFGALRGLETFSQLAFTDAGAGSTTSWLLPSVSIRDSPRFSYRAIMIDTARMFRPVPLLEEMLEAMAATKLNVLYLHLTDDNCWPLEILSFPLLTNPNNCSKGCRGPDGHPGQYYSQADIHKLVSYAKDRGIRVIPEVPSPGNVSHGLHHDHELTGICHIFPNCRTESRTYLLSGAGRLTRALQHCPLLSRTADCGELPVPWCWSRPRYLSRPTRPLKTSTVELFHHAVRGACGALPRSIRVSGW